MKNKKLLSLILSVCMILGIAGIPAYAEENDITEEKAVETEEVNAVPEEPELQEEEAELTGTAEYYVLNSASGDGRSVDNPAPNVAAAIVSINEDGYGKGDTVIVNIMQHADYYEKYLETSIGYGNYADTEGGTAYRHTPNSYLTSWGRGIADGSCDAYSATLHIRSYGSETNYLCYADGIGWNGAMTLGGNTEFENIIIVRPRVCDRYIYLNGRNTTFFEGVKFGCFNASEYDSGSRVWDGKVYVENSSREGGYIVLGCGAATRPTVTVKFLNAFNSIMGSNAKNTGFTLGDSVTIDGDVNVIFDNKDITTKLQFAPYSGTMVVNEDLNVVVNNATKIAYNSTMDGKLTVKGNLQMLSAAKVEYVTAAIGNGNSTFFDAKLNSVPDFTVNGGKWFISADDGNGENFLELTDTAGTFKVNKTGTAYAVNEKQNTVFYGENSLTLPEGTYDVKLTDNIESVLGTLSPVSEEPLMVFDKWVAEDGKYVATFKNRDAETYTYYVMYGGTGNGLTKEAPIGTISEAISAAGKAGAGKGDIINILIADAADWDYGKGTSVTNSTQHHMTYYDVTEHHDAKVIIRSAGETKAHLAMAKVFCVSVDIVLAGPTEFYDINIVRMRKYDKGVNANGYDVTIGEGTTFIQTPFDVGGGTFDGNFQGCDGFVMYGASYKAADGNGGNIVIDTDNTVTLHMPARQNPDSKNFSNPSVIDVKKSGTAFNVRWGSDQYDSADKTDHTGVVTFILPKGIKYANSKNSECTRNHIIVDLKGGLQYIINSENDELGDLPDLVDTTGGLWIVKIPEDGTILPTDTAGTFTVTNGKYAYAYNKEAQIVYYGNETITLPAGTWEVGFTDTVEEIKTTCVAVPSDGLHEFKEWKEETPGVLTPVFELRTDFKTAEYWVEYGGTGDGKTSKTPAGSIKTVVADANKAGLTTGDVIKVNIMDVDKLFDYRPKTTGRTTESHFTAWEQPAAHTATLLITGYEGTDSHLATAQAFGSTAQQMLSGPTIFDNITLVMMRVSDASIETMGHDATFTSSVVFKRMTSDFGSSTTWDGKLNDYKALIKIANQNGNVPTGKGGELVVDNENGGNGFEIRNSWRANGTYKDSVSIYLNNTTGDNYFRFGSTSGYKLTVTKNLNMSVASSGTTTFQPEEKGLIPVTVGGAVQFIHNKAATISGDVCGDLEVAGGYYELIVSENGKIKFTPNAGEYAVSGDKVAMATNTETKASSASKDGVLKLTPGTWEIEFIDASEKATVTFDGEASEEDYYSGTKVMLPVLSDTLLSEFKGWMYKGTLIPKGTLFTVPSGTVELTSSFSNFADTCLVFVDAANGSDSNSGLTKEAAVKTLSKAVSILSAKTEEVKKVVIIGNYKAGDASIPKHTFMLTISGDGTESSSFEMDLGYIYINGPTTFKNIRLRKTSTQAGKFLSAEGNRLIFDEGVSNEGMTVRFGKDNGSSNEPIDVTINSGTFGTIDVGAYYNSKGTRGKTGRTDIVINGGSVSTLNFYSDSYRDTMLGNDFEGNVSVIVNGGTLSNITVNATERLAPAFKKAFQVILNNGASTNVPEVSADGGAYIMKIAKNEYGGKLVATENPGTFKIEIDPEYAEYTAIAESTGGTYVSKDGILTIGKSGIYNVTFSEKIYYVNDGEVIHSYENNVPVDLSVEAHAEKPGMLFLGWADKDGNGVAKNTTLNEGDELFAKYVKFTEYDKYSEDEIDDYSGDLWIQGVQMRLADPADEVEQGLRFIVERGAFGASLPEIVEEGTYVLPSDMILGKEMIPGTSYSAASGVGDKPRKVPAVNYKLEADGSKHYTVCITGIKQANYNRYYTVKAYLIWKDYNGIEHTMYSDYYQSSLYRVAKLAKENPNEKLTTEQEKNINDIITYVEDTARVNYFKANYDSRATLDENGNLVLVDPTQADRISLLSGYNGKNWNFIGSGISIAPSTQGKADARYQMYSLKNGLKVREVTIDSGVESDGNPIEVVHFADAHFNYYNQRDLDEANPALMSTIVNRTWNRGGTSAINGLLAVEYANYFDMAVVTGDMMDYLAWGTADMMKQILVDRLNNAYFAMGNHEPTRRMQGTVADPYADQYQVLEHIWPHDIYFESEIMKDDAGVEKVMIVTMDNNRDRYWDSQIEPMKKAIAECRAKGIPMIIFQHDPINTNGNPDKLLGGEVYGFYEAGDLSGVPWNFNNDFARSSLGGATQTVYELITQNADVVKGLFCGHWHCHMYTEVYASYPGPDGKPVTEVGGKRVVIPQYIVTANAYQKGSVIKIAVK